jgi:hypothetical protein
MYNNLTEEDEVKTIFIDYENDMGMRSTSCSTIS